MATATDFTDVVNYQAFVEQFGEELLHSLIFGFRSAEHLNPFEGVKGRLTLTKFKQLQGNVVAYSSTYSPAATHELSPVHLDTYRIKYEYETDPGEMESNYTGFMRQTGQNPADNPLELVQTMKAIQEVNRAVEVAIWQGERIASPVAGTTPISGTIDGYGHIMADAIVAGDIAANATGALTTANIGDHLETQYDALHPELKVSGEAITYMSVQDMQKYKIWRRDKYAGNVTEDFNVVRFDTGLMDIVFLPGIPANAMVTTFKGNLLYGYDGSADMSTFLMNDTIYTQQKAMLFRIGAQIGIKESDLLIPNDQW